ncbi:PREDICTED: uncharacterized protein LOC104800624 [Tarenaya hassleriana]|uniref:uncharacterized protein LOC104800624 n=1 Tax=Tarenaya hassleriana TaxID=28532 RepID=UPI0008FD76D3|nr:PREDICTED: uncharacterized protein LOC104800624 [Tarenaya hassleriana]XP_019056507.1 PREDICTED: uncharacterized protein LOC104800624 [Tarenaya hassleriana]
MATPASVFPAKKTELPPKRGRIKREIFIGLARSIASAAARASRARARVIGEDGGGRGGASSACTTPPTSGYTSEENN